MASYTFQESSGKLSNAIMIVKENNVVVDANVVVTVNLDPVGQTAETCMCDQIVPKEVVNYAYPVCIFMQLWISQLELYP